MLTLPLKAHLRLVGRTAEASGYLLRGGGVGRWRRRRGVDRAGRQLQVQLVFRHRRQQAKTPKQTHSIAKSVIGVRLGPRPTGSTHKPVLKQCLFFFLPAINVLHSYK